MARKPFVVLGRDDLVVRGPAYAGRERLDEQQPTSITPRASTAGRDAQANAR